MTTNAPVQPLSAEEDSFMEQFEHEVDQMLEAARRDALLRQDKLYPQARELVLLRYSDQVHRASNLEAMLAHLQRAYDTICKELADTRANLRGRRNSNIPDPPPKVSPPPPSFRR